MLNRILLEGDTIIAYHEHIFLTGEIIHIDFNSIFLAREQQGTIQCPHDSVLYTSNTSYTLCNWPLGALRLKYKNFATLLRTFSNLITPYDIVPSTVVHLESIHALEVLGRAKCFNLATHYSLQCPTETPYEKTFTPAPSRSYA